MNEREEAEEDRYARVWAVEQLFDFLRSSLVVGVMKQLCAKRFEQVHAQWHLIISTVLADI